MKKSEKRLIETVWEHYRRHGRHELPWRKTTNPYRILVSEVMLQQTQVERVIPKYREFLRRFPSARALARAGLGDVLRAWQGLGYNRRAKMLHEAAQAVAERGGRFPRTYEELRELPGVGPYTAGAVMAFAYDEPVQLIETNIRTVYLRHFFNGQTDIDDRQILRSIGVMLDRQNPREWYWALMDYGAHLKKTNGNANVRSAHYTKQSRFKGSDRQIRGAILRALTGGALTKRALEKVLSYDELRIYEQLQKLRAEGLVAAHGRLYSLPD